ncbi:hypothetical protein EZJ19_10385 [Parasulfuritortus cantonensis]|uniref:Uncharacterized protein n=1 Tax=Parasulfuritortus cantonensis TaxID=2528202 RepID=A0A4R1B9B4_9PROT|nr:hypothetical protein [Parasulfuritortus cantonensis]TCJ13449.1 hypothetical protein EZJ19_10385 [Parasulfuritortus cantonensis]
MQRPDIHLHRYYSNGAYGRSWGVRMITGIATDPETGLETVSFKGVAGRCRRQAGTCTSKEFVLWAKYEVALNENSWLRVGNDEA